MGVLAARRVVKAGLAVARTERRKREAIFVWFVGGLVRCLAFDAVAVGIDV